MISANPKETTSQSVLGSSCDFSHTNSWCLFLSFSCDATATSLGQPCACRPSIHVGLREEPVSADTFWCIAKLSDPWLSIFLTKYTGQICSFFFYCTCLDLKTGGISRDSDAAACIIFFFYLILSLWFLILVLSAIHKLFNTRLLRLCIAVWYCLVWHRRPNIWPMRMSGRYCLIWAIFQMALKDWAIFTLWDGLNAFWRVYVCRQF